MRNCPHCAYSIETPYEQSLNACPNCLTNLPANLNSAWVDVARVTNLAEAGFLSDELIGLDIDARIHQADDFSELLGGWKTYYLIRVPSELAQSAADRIRVHVGESAAEADAARTFGFTSEEGAVDSAYWRPMAVIVLAGVASFVLGRQSAITQADRLPPPDSLAAAVGAIGRPFVTEAPAGSPRHRIHFDRRRQTWNLEADVNGDGIFETHRQFQSARVTR
jgi:hypothetical protein